MRCPGQDRAYWQADSVFEVPCPKCGRPVEFFKDESSRRCSACKHKFKNPKTSFGCAKWCSHAKECLGFAPQREPSSSTDEGALASCLIQAAKEEFAQDQTRLAHALLAFQHAKELARKEGGDPRVVLSAALLLETAASCRSGEPPADGDGPPRTKAILQRIGLAADVIERVCRIIAGYRLGEDLGTVEFNIVTDSDKLAKLASEELAACGEKPQIAINDTLRTETARQKARSLFRA